MSDNKIHRIQRRVSRLERRLDRVQAIQKSGKRGHVMMFVLAVIEDSGADLDSDDDGTISIDEIVEEVADRLDELLVFSGLAELITDFGIKAFAWAAVMIHQGRVPALQRRLKRNRRRLVELEARRAA